VVTHRYFQEAEMIFKELDEKQKSISVELRTALLKAFALSGDLAKADVLFHLMCSKGEI
jgi:pentatricopeptide repeat protein